MSEPENKTALLHTAEQVSSEAATVSTSTSTIAAIVNPLCPARKVIVKSKSALTTAYLAFATDRLKAAAIAEAKNDEAAAFARIHATNREKRTLDAAMDEEEPPPPPTPIATRTRRIHKPKRTFDTVADFGITHDVDIDGAHTISSERAAEYKDCPVFHPTRFEWSNPVAFIRSITAAAAPFGVCKIIPPVGWSPPFNIDPHRHRFHSRVQPLHTMRRGVGFDKSARSYSFAQFQELAERFRREYIDEDEREWNESVCETEYWDHVSGRSESNITVEYGSDVDSTEFGSGFEPLNIDSAGHILNDTTQYAGGIGWNLRALPMLRGSLLGLLDAHCPGVSTPYVYIAMLFSTFCWHNEDDYLFSINYLHCGAPKTWYGVSGDDADIVERIMKKLNPHADDDLHYHLCTIIEPYILQQNNDNSLNISHTIQYAGEYIITFPKAYHCGFSHGFNVGEAVNYASCDWLPFAREAIVHYQQYKRQPIISTQAVCFKVIQSIINLNKDLVANDHHQPVVKLENQPNSHNGANHSHCVDVRRLGYDPSDLSILLDELSWMINAETFGRTICRQTGVRSHKPMSDDATHNESDAVTCVRCAVYAYHSYVYCIRCKLPPACIAHPLSACQCSDKLQLSLYYRYTIPQLNNIKAELELTLKQTTQRIEAQKIRTVVDMTDDDKGSSNAAVFSIDSVESSKHWSGKSSAWQVDVNAIGKTVDAPPRSGRYQSTASEASSAPSLSNDSTSSTASPSSIETPRVLISRRHPRKRAVEIDDLATKYSIDPAALADAIKILQKQSQQSLSADVVPANAVDNTARNGHLEAVTNGSSASLPKRHRQKYAT